MIAESWFDTIGKQHMQNFFGQIERAYQIGKDRGLPVNKVSADELFRIYRGVGKLYEDDEQTIRNLYKDGMKKADIAREYGTSWTVINNILISG